MDVGAVGSQPGSDPELADVLRRVTLRPTRRVAASVVDLAHTPVSRPVFIGADMATAFEIGSITKGLTGMLLADALSRGEVGLQTTVAAVLPETARSGLGSMSLQQLGTHTSGLPRLPRTPFFLFRAVVLLGMLGLDPYRGTTTAQVVNGAMRQRIRDPGRWAYSNLGGAVLGQVLARAASSQFGPLLTERVLGPVGMVDSRVATRATAASPGRSAFGLPRMPWVLDGFAPAGGVVSTLTDMTRLTVALLTGRTESGLTTPGRAALDALPGVDAGVTGRRTGMFWLLDASPTTGNARVWHNGATGGYSAFMAVYPNLRRGLVVLTSNARGADTQRIAAALADAVVH